MSTFERSPGWRQEGRGTARELALMGQDWGGGEGPVRVDSLFQLALTGPADG